MNTRAVAQRVPSLPPSLLNVLACLAQGMSNRQIAARLGYKNEATAAVLVARLTKRLGLRDVYSKTEKRQLAAEAFNEAKNEFVTIKLSPARGTRITGKSIILSEAGATRMRSLLRRGYAVELIAVTLRKPPQMAR